MKRNNETVRVAKRKRGKQSSYAAKRNAGRQLYGPGCCAHKVDVDSYYRTHGRIPGDEVRISAEDLQT